MALHTLDEFPPLPLSVVGPADRARLLLHWTDQTAATNPSGAVTDQNLVHEIQYHMLEPPDSGEGFVSGKWTKDEVIAYFNQVQRQFIHDTLLVMTVEAVPTAAGTLRHALPAGWIATRRAAWAPSTLGSVYEEVPKGSGWEADHDPGVRTWPTVTAARPSLYMDAELPHLEFQLAPAPATDGTLELLMAALSTLLTGEGVALVVPDEFAPAIKYGVMALMLGKRGDAFDPERAAYCQSRYDEGVAAANLLWISS